MLGHTSQEGYEHDSSKSIRGDLFCGLLCDEVNQDELHAERVQNWVAQLRSEGILDGSEAGAGQQAAAVDIVVEEAATAPLVSGEKDLVSELQAENTRLKKMLLDDSKMMDQMVKTEMQAEVFIPHTNSKTAMTMWVSTDGRKAYYTKEASMSQ